MTRSHTGLKNVLSLLAGTDNIDLNVFYVARSYLTRHGAGPLPHELPHLPYERVIDHTNVTNQYQGSLRYAWFNLPLLKTFIQRDLNKASAPIKINHHIAVTCLDQVGDQITFIDNNKINKATQTTFLQKLTKQLNVSTLLCNFSPTIETIRELKMC